MVTVSLSSARTFTLYNNNKKKPCLSLQSPLDKAKRLTTLAPGSSSFRFNPLRFSISYKETMIKKNKSRGFGTVCYAAPLTKSNLQWISTISSAVLMLSKGTAVQKSFIVPLFALQAPASIISWIKGEYGMWTAFLALLVRLFYFIPGELELPFVALLLVIVAPYQVMNLSIFGFPAFFTGRQLAEGI